jgi:hypothetical protein
MKPQSFFDLILQNSKAKNENFPSNTQQNVQTPTSVSPNFFLMICGFFFFAFFLYLGADVISTKFALPSFSYFEILKLYIAAAVLKRLIK